MRLYAVILASLLALQSIWLIAAEALRPALPFFPGTEAEASAAAGQSSAAATSALIGWPRGELWIDYAKTSDAELLRDLVAGASTKAPQNNSISQTAARLLPADARSWLLLAAEKLGSPAGAAQRSLLLKTSYYTSPYNGALFPARIQIAARLGTADDELRGFIDYELTQWLRNNPEAKRPVALAYRAGSPAGRSLLAATVGRINPIFLSELHAAYP